MTIRYTCKYTYRCSLQNCCKKSPFMTKCIQKISQEIFLDIIVQRRSSYLNKMRSSHAISSSFHAQSSSQSPFRALLTANLRAFLLAFFSFFLSVYLKSPFRPNFIFQIPCQISRFTIVPLLFF